MFQVKISKEDVLTVNGIEVPGGSQPRFLSLFSHITPKAKVVIGTPKGHSVEHPDAGTHYIAFIRADQASFDMLKQFVSTEPVDMENEETVIIRDDGEFRGKRYAEIYHVIRRPKAEVVTDPAEYDDE